LLKTRVGLSVRNDLQEFQISC